MAAQATAWPACRYPCAADEAEDLGRSGGGFTTKLHALTDVLGHPLKVILTGGQAANIGQAENPLAGIGADAVLGDKRYDADPVPAGTRGSGHHRGHPAAAKADIALVPPPRRSRSSPR